MAGDENAEHLFFPGQLLLHGPIGKRGQGMFHMLRLSCDHAEESGLTALAIFPGPLPALHRVLDHRRQLRSIAA